MGNMQIYEAVRAVPPEALKKIQGGKLTGKSDINPMWRLKTLTEQFGACGIGWKYNIDRQWIEPAADGELAAFVNISMYIRQDGKWSEAIPGTGGSMLVQTERGKLASNDEAYNSKHGGSTRPLISLDTGRRYTVPPYVFPEQLLFKAPFSPILKGGQFSALAPAGNIIRGFP